ncbi:MAG: ABC transporter ATP-binding protein [Anaerolineae bacterium]|nr:ABC transporter ATP-binding protein [Anaerolineae bacterium]
MKFLKRSNGKHPEDAAAIPPVIDIREITKTYQMGAEELRVLKGISLRIERGEFVSIMGPSGSGKSTLMNILGALDQPTSGQYFLDGEDISRLSQTALARIRNHKIGFVFQNFNLLKRTSAQRQVELPLIYAGASNRSGRAKAALESVGLGDRLKHLPSELSGGQQQRVAIARALVTEPSIILADEPTGNLDSRSGAEVMQIFQRLNREQQITTVFVTHDPWIARHTNRVIMIRDGMIVADQQVAKPLVAGVDERPSEAEELAGIFQAAYYGEHSAESAGANGSHAHDDSTGGGSGIPEQIAEGSAAS